jgi:L-cysteine/cystine lyase
MAKKVKLRGSSDADKLAAIRAQLPAATVAAYLNAGTNGPLSQPAHQALIDAARAELDQGRIGPTVYPGMFEALSRTRATIAGMLNAEPSEIGLMRSTTEGMNVALMGVAWRPGDEVVTTQLEHICLFSALGLLSHRQGVTVRTIDIGNGGGDVLGAIQAALTPRTRVIAISHIQWSTGAVMPLKEIAALARERGILTVVDAAQSAGQIPLDLHDLGVDAYAMAGQKWLCGPGGTGAIFVRRDRIGDIRPTYLRYGAFDAHGFVVPPDGAVRYEMGEVYGPAIRALDAGLTWMREDVDLNWAYTRVAALGARLADGLARIEGVCLLTPRERMAGLVSFTVDGIPPKQLNDSAYERGFTIRSIEQRPGPAAVRASTGWWCTEGEIDGLIELISEFAKKGIA